MGDRCYISVTVKTEDLERFGKATGWGGCWEEQDREEGEEFTNVTLDDVNYGGDDELSQAAAEGIPFLGHHGPGDCYGGCLFACDGKGEYWQTDCDSDGYPTVRYDVDSGKAEAHDVRHVKRFCKKHREVKAVVCVTRLPTGLIVGEAE